jgi:hypothetical protein
MPLWYHRSMTEEERREAGQRLAGFRTKKTKVCPVDGTSFETWGKGIYCSNSCKLKAWRERQRRPAQRSGGGSEG